MLCHSTYLPSVIYIDPKLHILYLYFHDFEYLQHSIPTTTLSYIYTYPLKIKTLKDVSTL